MSGYSQPPPNQYGASQPYGIPPVQPYDQQGYGIPLPRPDAYGAPTFPQAHDQPPQQGYSTPGYQQGYGAPASGTIPYGPGGFSPGFPQPPPPLQGDYAPPPSQSYPTPGAYGQHAPPLPQAPYSGAFTPLPQQQSGYSLPPLSPQPPPPHQGGYAPPSSQVYPAPGTYGQHAPPPQQGSTYGAGGFPPPSQQHYNSQAPPHVPRYYLGTLIHPSENPLLPSHEKTPPSIAVDAYLPENDVETIYRACKGFGTNEKKIMGVFAHIAAVRLPVLQHAYKARHGADLNTLLKKELGGNFETFILQVALGPLKGDIAIIEKACSGAGTNETALTEVLIGRSPFEMDLLKAAFQQLMHKNLEKYVLDELSLKTRSAMQVVLLGDWADQPNAGRTASLENIGGGVQSGFGGFGQAPMGNVRVDQGMVGRDMDELKRAVKTVVGSVNIDVQLLSSIVFARSPQHLNSLQTAYINTHRVSLTKHVKRGVSGHLKEMLLFALEGAKKDTNGAWRDAKKLYKAMEGMGTKDILLIRRLVRAHWDPTRFGQVKQAYQAKYHKTLSTAVSSETSGDYRDGLMALIGS